MRWLFLAAVLLTAACSSSKYRELPHTSKSDPIWQLNVGKWDFQENALTTPPPAPPPLALTQ